jgi:hypothetical protein
MSGGNHSAFLADEESSSVLSGRPFGKVVIEKYLKIVLWSWIYALLELALGFGFSAGMCEQGRLKEDDWNLKPMVFWCLTYGGSKGRTSQYQARLWSFVSCIWMHEEWRPQRTGCALGKQRVG